MPKNKPHFTKASKTKVMRALNHVSIAAIRSGEAGLTAAALMIKRDAVNQTPWDTGNLAGSAYVRSYTGILGPNAEVGYSAVYALAVHETDKNYRVGNWKFLQNALDANRGKIMATLKKYARFR
jgi:hypothetical protein